MLPRLTQLSLFQEQLTSICFGPGHDGTMDAGRLFPCLQSLNLGESPSAPNPESINLALSSCIESMRLFLGLLNHSGILFNPHIIRYVSDNSSVWLTIHELLRTLI